MTTAALSSPTAPWPDTGGATVEEATDHRDGPGRLRIDARVVQKLAAQAANEVQGVSQATAGPIGRAIHRPVPASTPSDQLSIDLDLAVSVRYPLSLRVVADQLAAHVARRVEELSGRPVGRVRVNVQRLRGPDSAEDRPRVR